MTDQEIQEIVDREAKASPENWYIASCNVIPAVYLYGLFPIDKEVIPGLMKCHPPIVVTYEDGNFIANAKSDIPKLIKEVTKYRDVIKTHRDQKADDRCIEDDDRLYEALGDGIKCDRRVGSKAEMKLNCDRFIENRCQEGGWPTYRELEEKLRFCQTVIYHLFDEGGAELHEPGCPEDDTCNCPLAKEMNKAMEGWGNG